MTRMTAEEAIKQGTGVKAADQFIADASELGLTVEVSVLETPEELFEDGSVMLTALTSISVIVRIPVPEELGNNALTLMERNVTLISCWAKRHNGRARGRWTSANYSDLGGHEDMHVFKRCQARLATMAMSLRSLQSYVNEN